MTESADKGRDTSSVAQAFLDISVEAQRGEFQLSTKLQVAEAGVTALFGASGSGKTSLLRVLAGFDRATGSIRCGNEIWLDSEAGINVPTHQRGVGLMFQDARLFAHLNVAENLQFARRRAAKLPQIVDYDAVVAAFELEPLLARRSTELSGGEAQRVALARTLLTQPQLLLLDEPLAALDDQRKADLLPYLETLVREFSIPLLYVSHDIDEVARLAPNMVVLEAGAVVAQGTTAELFARLDLPEVSGRLEAHALLQGVVVEQDQHWQLTRLSVGGQELSVPLRARLVVGNQVQLRVRARDVALAIAKPTGLSIRNVLAGRLVELQQSVESPFAEVLIELSDGGVSTGEALGYLRSRITRAAAAELQLSEGQTLYALVKTVSFDA